MRPELAKVFRERLRQLRDAKGFTQEQLESRIGKVGLETGRILTPPFEVIDKLADALEVEPAEFFLASGVGDSSEELLRKVQDLLSGRDPDEIRKAYRLLLLALEK
jgi:transcriptional regulator with XRE-family HTH domain